MNQIQKLCDEEWKKTGGAFGQKSYLAFHKGFIEAFRIARELAAKTAEGEGLAGTVPEGSAALIEIKIRRLGEENV